ncbi:MAG: 3'-5' exonuclease [Methylacidiphilales bacterium]|nr:3'-5' exonuclease [Candidatus Methylacidiphilales bacterium]
MSSLPLNPEQQIAVELPVDQHGLILSGAGTGKTRVLAYRVAHLIMNGGLRSNEILILTFTNKASREMKHRVRSLLGGNISLPWAGTFHGVGRKFIEKHTAESGWEKPFQIMDSQDQFSFIKKLLLEQSSQTPEKEKIKGLQFFINKNKENGYRAHSIPANALQNYEYPLVPLYKIYEARTKENRLLDFAELILKPVELFKQDAIANHYHSVFKAILIDEFQDTSPLQYSWLRFLSRDVIPMFAVGDDDQSIYGWRGADAKVLQQFHEELRNVKLIKLEQNYRSNATILSLANFLISHNKNRLGKKLWTERKDGEFAKHLVVSNEHSEAKKIAERIQALLQQGVPANEIAVLYRLNRLSRLIEQQVLQRGIACEVYGGVSFFAREEIKNALAYIRLARNPHDMVSFERVVNVPMRGIGEKSLEQIKTYARDHACSDYTALSQLVAGSQLPPRVLANAKTFIDGVAESIKEIATTPLAYSVKSIITRSGLLDYYKEKQKKSHLDIDRIENIGELVSAAKDYERDQQSEFGLEPGALADLFLDKCALGDSDNETATSEDKIKLMTVHAAKGLEFKAVFIAGMEHGTFPHAGFEGEMDLEEERRLCYVAITRAKEQLTLTSCLSRTIFGSHQTSIASCFFKELPEQLIVTCQELDEITHQSRPTHYSSENATSKNHTRVRHPLFGIGLIIETKGEGDDLQVLVRFDKLGSRWLMAKYANLQKL